MQVNSYSGGAVGQQEGRWNVNSRIRSLKLSTYPSASINRHLLSTSYVKSPVLERTGDKVMSKKTVPVFK